MSALFQPVIDYYNNCAELIDDDAKAMGWSSYFNQQLRFDVFNFLVDLTDQSVLDVGCGDGAFFHYLKKQNISCQYQGIDIASKMVQRAQARYPGIQVRKADFMSLSGSYDVVVCSGGLSMVQTNDPMEFLKKAIHQLYLLTNVHLVFNLLSINSPAKSHKFQRFSPSDVLQYCFTLTPYVSLHHSYLPNVFTLHLVKY